MSTVEARTVIFIFLVIELGNRGDATFRITRRSSLAEGIIEVIFSPANFYHNSNTTNTTESTFSSINAANFLKSSTKVNRFDVVRRLMNDVDFVLRQYRPLSPVVSTER